ncbi:MAG: hypothetical protein HYZ34_03580 [Ignavibacteriae bacterium]|nr:hypothetical protein [Ignavibacteriota bacterium]
MIKEVIESYIEIIFSLQTSNSHFEYYYTLKKSTSRRRMEVGTFRKKATKKAILAQDGFVDSIEVLLTD